MLIAAPHPALSGAVHRTIATIGVPSSRRLRGFPGRAHPSMTPSASDAGIAPQSLRPPPTPELASLALFLDIDGTLLEFADRPDDVSVDTSLVALLRELWQRLDGALALISGRPLHAIDALLGLPQAAAAGLHGAQVRDAEGRIVIAPATSPQLSSLQAHAAELVATLPGVVVENKPNALALHYRLAPHAAAAVQDAAETLLREAGRGYTLQAGNHVIEIKPAGVDKGRAVAALMRRAPFAGRTPWVLGDDLTDEDAFRTAQGLEGVGIIVGARRPTAAGYALPGPRDVQAWLRLLLVALPRGGADE
jgi:trehalose 6-phosphate phosphatase